MKNKIMSLRECDYVLKQDLIKAVEMPLAKYNRAQKLIKRAILYVVILAVIGFIFRNQIYAFLTGIF